MCEPWADSQVRPYTGWEGGLGGGQGPRESLALPPKTQPAAWTSAAGR